MHLALKIKKL